MTDLAPELSPTVDSTAQFSNARRTVGSAPVAGQAGVRWLRHALASACVLGCGVWFWHANGRGAPAAIGVSDRASTTSTAGLETANSAVPETRADPTQTSIDPVSASSLASATSTRAADSVQRTTLRAPRKRPPQPSAAHDAVATGDPAAELALLKLARVNARSAPLRALSLIVEHERDFAQGTLVEEREVIAIEALLVSGQRVAAETRAALFGERFGNSAHARRVRVLLTAAAPAQFDKNAAAAPHLQH
jgi:hypothetical protein